MTSEEKKDLLNTEDTGIEADAAEKKEASPAVEEAPETASTDKPAEEAKTKKCVECGKEIPADAGFCHHCGTAQVVKSAPAKSEAKGIDKKLIAAIAVIVALLLIIAFGVGKMTGGKPGGQEVVKEEAEETAEAAEEISETEVEETPLAEDSGSSSEMTASEKREKQEAFTLLVKTAAGDELSEQCVYEWDYDKDIFFINMVVPEAANLTESLYRDNAKVQESWKNLNKSNIKLCKSMYGLMENSDLKGCHVCVNIVTDESADNVLFSVYDDGEVLYDVMNQ